MTVKELLEVLAKETLENEDAMDWKIMVVTEHEEKFIAAEVEGIDESGRHTDYAAILLARSIGELVS